MATVQTQQIDGPAECEDVSVILKGNKDFNQQQLERLVIQHGGDFCQMQLADGSAMVISSSDKSEFELSLTVTGGHAIC